MSDPHPFRFGAVTAARTALAWAEQARALESAGFSTVLAPDTMWTHSPFLALTAAAAATSTLRLGTWVLASPLRSPAAVARETRTLQELSGGRAELGIGAGRPGGEQDAEALGVPWGSPGERVSRVAEIAEAVAALDDAPPIVIAGSGDRMLGIAGRWAATLALPVPPTATVAEVGALAERARRRARADIELSLQLTAIGDEVPERLRRQGMTSEVLRAAGAVGALSGDVGADVEALERLRAETGVSYLTISAESAARLAPLVARLAGR